MKVAGAGDGAAAVMTTVEDVPDHLLEVILLRLDSSVSLLRAAAACTRWRRVVADAGFLRSFRSLHGARHVAGRYHTVDPLRVATVGRWQLCRLCAVVAAGDRRGKPLLLP